MRLFSFPLPEPAPVVSLTHWRRELYDEDGNLVLADVVPTNGMWLITSNGKGGRYYPIYTRL